MIHLTQTLPADAPDASRSTQVIVMLATIFMAPVVFVGMAVVYFIASAFYIAHRTIERLWLVQQRR